MGREKGGWFKLGLGSAGVAVVSVASRPRAFPLIASSSLVLFLRTGVPGEEEGRGGEGRENNRIGPDQGIGEVSR